MPQPNKTPKKPLPFFEWMLGGCVILLVLLFHRAALEDRFLLVLSSVGIAGSLYIFLKRRAFVMTVIVTAVTGSVFLATIYFDAPFESWHPILDPIRDVVGLGILLFLVVALVYETHNVQKTDREREVKQQFEEQMTAMRAETLRSTSHEVRTPLSTILTINETLISGCAGELTELQREFLHDIDQAARHLMDLVNDILDFAKAEAGMIQLALEPVALAELVEQCVKMVEPKAEQAGVKITVQISPEVNETVADPLRLKQVVLNLLSNAIKFNVRDGMVNIWVRRDKGNIVIGVRDTGRGISHEHLEHLFNPYFQATRKDQGIGTGLGLAIIKHLVELHGGDIAVESVVDTGSTFSVRLPNLSGVDSADSDGTIVKSSDSDPATSDSLSGGLVA